MGCECNLSTCGAVLYIVAGAVPHPSHCIALQREGHADVACTGK